MARKISGSGSGKKRSHKSTDKRAEKRRGGAPARKKKADSGKHSLPEVAVLEVVRIDDGGEMIAAPVKWDGRKAPPHIVLSARGMSAPVEGDRVLARLSRKGTYVYEASLIRVLPGTSPRPVLGMYIATAGGGMIEPIDRRNKESFFVMQADTAGAQHGELVAGETLPTAPGMRGPVQAKITERLGPLSSARAASLIAIHAHDLPIRFSSLSLKEAEAAEAPVMETGRTDLRNIPLITIDGEDARDFDDAVFAEADAQGGFHLVVAIADVSHYVAEESALDRDAFLRGNSVYFPDRVVPMLPEALSNGLCSLNPNEDRYCLAVHLWIDANGKTMRYRFERGLMRSGARMTYNEVQKISDSGAQHAIITPLYAAYKALMRERDARGALELNLPEYKIALSAEGNVSAILPRERHESHKLIEAFMIAANVAAADFLIKQKQPGVYRVHQPPDELKLLELRAMLEHMGYHLSKGDGIKPAHLNKVLLKAMHQPEEVIVHQSILRAQMQAYYAPQNLGHFGLGLTTYCHFTSPIRRYADLMVHRSIIAALEGKKHTKNPRSSSEAVAHKNTRSSSEAVAHKKPHAAGAAHLDKIADHISKTERKAMQAERDAMDRYKASYMSDKVGDVFRGVITGVSEAGLFVTLPENGVTGFIPMRALGFDFFHYDKKRGELRGQRSKKLYALGEALMIRVEQASGITGSLLFAPDALPLPQLQRPFGGKGKHKGKRGQGKDKGGAGERRGKKR